MAKKKKPAKKTQHKKVTKTTEAIQKVTAKKFDILCKVLAPGKKVRTIKEGAALPKVNADKVILMASCCCRTQRKYVVIDLPR